MIHAATLVHDDVIDAAETRRGRPSTNVKWGNHTCVLAGDWLYMQAFQIALRERNFQILELLISLTQMMVEGELLQLERIGVIDVSEADCMELVDRKTACLFSVCARLGAVCGRGDAAVQEKLGEYAWNLGMAFQLVDDVLDFTAREKTLGKPVGGDLREGKVTLPLVYALECASPAERRLVENILERRSYHETPFARILALLEKYNAHRTRPGAGPGIHGKGTQNHRGISRIPLSAGIAGGYGARHRARPLSEIFARPAVARRYTTRTGNGFSVDFIGFDSAYLERLAAGDAATEEHFNRYFGELVLIKLRARRLEPHVIDDIRQETFLRVLQALRKGSIRQPDAIGAFVNSVCNNIALEFQRAGSRTTFFDEAPDTPDGSVDSERRLIDGERRAHVRHLMERMPARNRRLLTAVFLDERSIDEVCGEFGVDRNYLRVLLFRARAQLREAVHKSAGRTAGA